MPRGNKRNAKARVVRKTQKAQSKSLKVDKEKPADLDENIKHLESSKDEVPTTSKQVTQINSNKNENFEGSVKKTVSLCSITTKKCEKVEKDQSAPNISKKKRKPFNRLIYFSDSDDDEPHIGLPTMRYVDVARAAMLGTDEPVQAQPKIPTQVIDMGLEEFPLLQPIKFPNSEMTSQHFEKNDSDSSAACSVANLHESDLSDTTECYLINDKEKDLDNHIDEMEEASKATDPCIDPNSSVCCGIDDVSSTGSYWAEGSNDTGSENETISCTEDGGGDASYTYNNANECPQQNAPEPTSTFSQEWLDSTVRTLALPFGVSVQSFNFTQPDINFARFERQFDDPHYRRMEDRALFALRLALNKSFFGEGNYM